MDNSLGRPPHMHGMGHMRPRWMVYPLLVRPRVEGPRHPIEVTFFQVIQWLNPSETFNILTNNSAMNLLIMTI